ncbi:conserved hypothetical protein [Trichinella spiralis]|uniref:hypothetical protein n=1 Tax=Trichinella spiralis TaxID=6334 RepID=UPI0001EFB84F|nr:conserved hypothetical protein [Trichinella spiralis]
MTADPVLIEDVENNEADFISTCTSLKLMIKRRINIAIRKVVRPSALSHRFFPIIAHR